MKVTNNSTRLMNVCGVMLIPGETTEDIQDTKENRATMKDVDGLDIGKAAKVVESDTDDGNSEKEQKSATGNNWTAKK